MTTSQCGTIPDDLRAYLDRVCAACGEDGVTVTSLGRSPFAQARAMESNASRDLTEQRRIYKAPGQKVLDVYCSSLHLSKDERIEAMRREIERVGPGLVSHHCLPVDSPIIVADIAKSSIAHIEAFRRAAQSDTATMKILDENGAIHLEILKLQ